MKTILSIFALVAIATAQEPEACAVCRQGTGALMAALGTEEALEWQQQTLIEEGCSQAEDPAGCAAGVETWWARMAQVVYTPASAAAVCHGLEPACQGPHPPTPPPINKAWDCDTCVADVQATANLIDSKEAGEALAHHLEGPAFCKSDDLGLDDEQVLVCDEYVKTGAVKGFQYIFKLVGQHAHRACHDVYGICEAPTTHAHTTHRHHTSPAPKF